MSWLELGTLAGDLNVHSPSLKEEIVRAGNYMPKVDGKSCSLEAKTVQLLISLLSTKGIYRENTNLVPTKYRFLEGAVAGHSSIVER